MHHKKSGIQEITFNTISHPPPNFQPNKPLTVQITQHTNYIQPQEIVYSTDEPNFKNPSSQIKKPLISTPHKRPTILMSQTPSNLSHSPTLSSLQHNHFPNTIISPKYSTSFVYSCCSFSFLEPLLATKTIALRLIRHSCCYQCLLKVPLRISLLLFLPSLYLFSSNHYRAFLLHFVSIIVFSIVLVISLNLSGPRFPSIRVLLARSFPIKFSSLPSTTPPKLHPPVVWSIGSKPKLEKRPNTGCWVQVHKNGDVYEGEFYRGKCSGSGVYYYYMSGRYEGDWIDEKYDGHGVETWAKGSRYRGQYRHGLRHGFGVYRFYTGDVYAGEWCNGQSHGCGVYTCEDGSRYVGEFKWGIKHGLGSYHFSYVIVADHDTSVLDYISDFVCCLYRLPDSCQVVSLQFPAREGINIFLDGFVPTINLRFREESLAFEVTKTLEGIPEELQPSAGFKYPSMSITRKGFKLMVNDGEFTENQIIVILGEKGTGKSTFMKMMAGRLKPDTVGGSRVEIPQFRVSYKPQYYRSPCMHSVLTVLETEIRDACRDFQFILDVMEPLGIMKLMSRRVSNLSKKELHKVLLCLCLGKPADIYLIDEPSAGMDIEEIIVAAKVMRSFIHRTKKTAFVVDRNFMLATYLADKVIVFEGIASIDCTANSPDSLSTGMNRFLSHLDISCKRDPINFRPVINKLNSDCDVKQKAAGQFYLEG